MLQRRTAKSTRSDNTEMDTEGTGELFLVLLSFFPPCCSHSSDLLPLTGMCAFNFAKQNQTWLNFRDSSGSWKEIGRPTVSRLGNRSASNSQQEIHRNSFVKSRCFYLQPFVFCDGRQEIEKLLKEQEELHRNLGACKSLSRQHQDVENTQSLQALLEQRDTIEKEMETEKQSQKQLQAEVD